jgi:DNA-nicking Smr family endonuclease
MTKKILTLEDSDLFRRSAGAVRPVNTDKVLLERRPKPKPVPRKHSANLAERLDGDIAHNGDYLSVEDRMLYYAPGIQKTLLKKLRGGHFGIDAELDLHGLNGEQAKHQLLHFLHHCAESGRRCVRIIHGKGYRSPENLPVLKNHLNLWLRQHRDVMAFCSAPRHDGGTGAVYALLRAAEKYGLDDEWE